MDQDTFHREGGLTDWETLRTVAAEQLNGSHYVGLLGLAALGIAPFIVADITVIKLTSALFFAVFVMSWDTVSGYTGQISFGHALFFGVGGYTSALLNVHYGVDPILGILAGTLMAAVVGLVIGVPALRVQGPYLSLVTLVAPLILLRTFVYFSEYTGGEVGLIAVGLVEKLTTKILPGYYLAFGLFLFALAVFLLVTRTDAGRVFTAIREDEDAVAAAGLNPAKFKVFAFVLSGTIGGLAGAVFAHSNVGSVSPSQLLSLTLSIEVIIAAIIGGIGTISGAAVGGFLFYLFRDWLSNREFVVPLLGMPVKELDLLLYFLVTLAVLFLIPEGIVPRVLRVSRAWLSDTDGSDPAADGGRPPARSAIARFRERLRTWLGGGRR